MICNAEKLRGKAADANDLVAEMDQAVADCDAAIANGRQRVDMPTPVSKMPAIVTKYEATSQKTKDDLRAALKPPPDETPK